MTAKLALDLPVRTPRVGEQSDREGTMQAFVAAMICVVVISVGSSYLLQTQQRTTDVAFSTVSTRVGPDAGHNLIGRNE